MKYIFTIYCLLICANASTFAQNQTIDIIKAEAKRLEGKPKVNALIDIAQYYLTPDYYDIITRRTNGQSVKIRDVKNRFDDNLLNYIEEAITLATSLDYLDGLAVAYYYQGDYYEKKVDLQNAELAYLNWYNTRVKEGDTSKIIWTYPTVSYLYYKMNDFPKAYEFAEKLVTTYIENKATPTTASEQYQRLLDKWYFYCIFYSHGGHTNYDLKMLEYCLDEINQFFQVNPYLKTQEIDLKVMDEGFERAIANNIRTESLNDARKVAKQWLKAKSIFVGHDKLYKTARRIARQFKYGSVNSKPMAIEFLTLSIIHAEVSGDDEIIRAAYNNAIFSTRVMDLPVSSFKYCIESKIYNDIDWEHFQGALNGCALRAEYRGTEWEIKEIIGLLEEWQNTLDREKDAHIIQWCGVQIERFKAINLK